MGVSTLSLFAFIIASLKLLDPESSEFLTRISAVAHEGKDPIANEIDKIAVSKNPLFNHIWILNCSTYFSFP